MISADLFSLDSQYHTKLTVGILIIPTRGSEVDIDAMLMQLRFPDRVRTCRAPPGISGKILYSLQIIKSHFYSEEAARVNNERAAVHLCYF